MKDMDYDLGTQIWVDNKRENERYGRWERERLLIVHQIYFRSE